MGRLDQLSWADFTAPWEHDVKAGLYWLQAALNQPLKPGSRVLVVSSGAAENGSPMSGGYGGAKRMLWFITKYANGVSEKTGLGIRFQAIVPQQMVLGTESAMLAPTPTRTPWACSPKSSQPASARRCRRGISARRVFPCWTRNMPMAWRSGSRAATRGSQCSRQRLEPRTIPAEPGPPGGAPRPGRRVAARFAPLLRTLRGIGHRRRGRLARHAHPSLRGVAGSG
jgi:hypothetical protein